MVSGGPYQPVPDLADGVSVRIQQLGPQCVQALVIQAEVFLQRAIGHPTAAPEKLYHLVEHRIEVHVSP